MLTIEQVKDAVPTALRTSVEQPLVDKLNQIAADPEVAEAIRENFITHSIVLKEGRFKVEDYFNAITYVSFKVMGYTNEESYSRTFPHRYQSLTARGASQKDIAAYVSGFNKGKLVNAIMEQTIIPAHVIYNDIFHKAIMTQANLMQTAQSEKVRTEAANSLIVALKKPEIKQTELKIDMQDSSGMKEMQAALGELAQKQKQLIEEGQMKTIDVAATRLVIKDE